MGKRMFTSKVVMLLAGTLLLATGFTQAGEIKMETYSVGVGVSGAHMGVINYKGKTVFSGFGYIELRHLNGERKRKITDHIFYPEKAVEKDGYKEITYSKTWEEDGFTYETNTKLYPKKIVYTVSYNFTKEWEGTLTITGKIDQDLALGAKYKAIDIYGMESEGIIEQTSKEKAKRIPKNSIGELELYPADGGKIKFKLEREDSYQYNGLYLSPLREGGRCDVNLMLFQQTPSKIFSAGYSNRITLEIEFK